MKDRILFSHWVIANPAPYFCLAVCCALLGVSARAQDSQNAEGTGEGAGTLKAKVAALEKKIELVREKIAEHQTALKQLQTEYDLATKDLALRGKAAQERGDTNAADLFASGIKEWKILDDFPSNGGLEAGENPGEFRMKMGDPLSGIRYDGPLDLPVTNYEISLEARRTRGTDFFCAVTFPVNSIKTCCTFVAGGWGGALAGISSLEGMDAANNDTSTFHKFELNNWYAFRIQITPELLKVWMDDEVIVDVELADRRVGMRWGDIEYCMPFGLATYLTTGEFRNLRVRRLDGKEIAEKKAAEAPSDDSPSDDKKENAASE